MRVSACMYVRLSAGVARGCGFADGYITSDCDADANVLNPHHYTKTAEEAVAAVLSAGTDVSASVLAPGLAYELGFGLVWVFLGPRPQHNLCINSDK